MANDDQVLFTHGDAKRIGAAVKAFENGTHIQGGSTRGTPATSNTRASAIVKLVDIGDSVNGYWGGEEISPSTGYATVDSAYRRIWDSNKKILVLGDPVVDQVIIIEQYSMSDGAYSHFAQWVGYALPKRFISDVNYDTGTGAMTQIVQTMVGGRYIQSTESITVAGDC